MTTLRSIALAATIFVFFSKSAEADPREGVLPKVGTSFEGKVQYVGDGDSFCVGGSTDPGTWIEIRVADFYAPELRSPEGRQAKVALERIALGKVARCVAGRRSYDRVVAQCSIEGAQISE